MLNLKIFFWLFLLITPLFLSTSFAEQASRTIKVTTIEYPPLMGAESGMVTEMVSAAFKAKSIHVEYEIYPMSRIIWSITEGHNDATVGSILWYQKNEQAQEVLVNNVYDTGMYFFYKKESFPKSFDYQKLEELAQYKIGYITGGALISVFANANITPHLVKDLKTNVKMLNKMRIDMFAGTELGGWEAIRNQHPDSMSEFSMSDKTIYDIRGGIMFPKGGEELQEQFQQGFMIIKNNGTYLKLLKKYYGDRKIPQNLLDIKY